MGYDGTAGQYVSANLVDETYKTTGVALDFYRSYDSTYRNVSEYFDPITAFNTSDFQTCEESRLSNVAMMQTYLDVTGDLDGVEMGGDSGRKAACEVLLWTLLASS